MEPQEYSILGNILNTTWGVGSTNHSRGATLSIKGQMLGDRQLVLSLIEVVSFGEPQDRQKVLEKARQESGSILDECIKYIKKAFKEQAGRTLKTENISDDDDWELLSLGQYSGRRDAYYRRKIVLELG